jgi:hypothetical protein
MPKVDERRIRLKELFFHAIELEDKNRRRFLDEMCGEDSELRAELESLLGRTSTSERM